MLNPNMPDPDLPIFSEAWADLGLILSDSDKAISTFGIQSPLQVHWVQDQGVQVKVNEQITLVPISVFEATWQALLHNKIINMNQIPLPDGYRSDVMASILALLPYVGYTTRPEVALFLKGQTFTHVQLSKGYEAGIQGGIRWSGQASAPPLVYFITDHTRTQGANNPYTDRWVGDVFHYCGAGLEGDQALVRGNLALKTNMDLDFPVFGFERRGKDKYVYIGQFKVEGMDQEQQHDSTGKLRKVYMFRMRHIGPLRRPIQSTLADNPVTQKEWALRESAGNDLTVSSPPPMRPDLAAVHSEFSSALKASYVAFGSRHDEIVRSFVASLATKRLVILTGLSGSGKTQIALRFGDWLGKERFLLVPVRPDWTGAEALFGYEDALQPVNQGHRAWHVPDVLAFILKAVSDPKYPYLLVLDEMNLAHVERYFADVLSGMESGEPCVPNLHQDLDGYWRIAVGAAPKVPLPTNLFIVGTVNVDETTYMFSAKVLDRANTFEFRVASADLSLHAHKPLSCDPGDPELVRGFLAIAQNDDWHLVHPATDIQVFTDHLRRLHQLLASEGFEFGHRVFYEAVRFAAMLEAAGDIRVEHMLDLQVIQKVLPRLHGTRRRLEPVLSTLGQFCFDLTCGGGDGAERFDPLHPSTIEPRLPLSLGKVQRMVRSLRANQFTSFTE